ncbi:nucleolar protein,Nop52-domain-containing protein [Aspergillus caelatus]|uniref:Nucleolar protein,Nop52-domain-containing protein n=1 Tax=Aspergillus caelatus TaxID=61420 RepID=A0A5N7A3T6_9EURO|nr:nucleolar protein,Nop52-domain-containing protein [Aspergillus caelatus]KAE8364243.1 nucleolar protein,Nop52-domain-containing protein [Aspergillus caelatus]
MTDLQKTPFVRELASSDKKIRDKATDSLTLFLRSRTDLSLIELLKLWKGLFFCFYHSDRPLTQQALARNLSYSLVPTIPRSAVHRFLRAFWITIGRDFHSLDRLRLDKYLLLIRFYVGVAFEIFLKGAQQKAAQDKDSNKKRKREAEQNGKSKKRSKGKKQSVTVAEEEEEQNDETKWAELESYISILEEGPLCPLNFDPDQPPTDEKKDYVAMPHGPDGLRYHVMDIWIDEVEKVLEFEEGSDGVRKPKGDVPIELILRPIEKLRADSPYKPVRTRAKETLEDERLVEWGFRTRKVESDDEEDSDEEWGGFD